MTDDDVHRGDMLDDVPTLAAFARDLLEAADSTPMPAVGAALASVLEGRSAAPLAPTPRVPRVAAPRRSVRLRWAIGGTVFGVGIGSLGVAGALPGSVQHQVARVGNVVGVDLPDPSETSISTTTTILDPTTSTVVRRPTATQHSATTVVGGARAVEDRHGDISRRDGESGTTTTTASNDSHRGQDGGGHKDGTDGSGGATATGTTTADGQDHSGDGSHGDGKRLAQTDAPESP
ncbi:MAG: hypothetical protein QOI47_1915 [Actinomycetota bacterium]|nr:hypothetical protein [Actinomycetota bacterium]